VLALNPRYAQGFNNLGSAYLMNGDLQQAIQAFAKALKLAPDNADFRCGRKIVAGLVHRRQRR